MDVKYYNKTVDTNVFLPVYERIFDRQNKWR